MELTWLCSLAFVAGFVDSVVGGGGLIQVPALFIFLPPALTQSVGLVLGTNKMSSICGTGMAVIQFTRRIPLNWRWVWPAGLAAFVFAFLGAAVVSSRPSSVMKPIILVLLVLVAAYTYFRKDLGQRHEPRFSPITERRLGICVGSGIGFYDGFFGPGTGSFLMFIFTGLFGFNFLVATASAKVLNFATNLSAVLYFAATGNILYHYAVPMGVCNILGALLGTRMAMLRGNAFIRLFFLAVVSAMIVRFGYELIFR